MLKVLLVAVFAYGSVGLAEELCMSPEDLARLSHLRESYAAAVEEDPGCVNAYGAASCLPPFDLTSLQLLEDQLEKCQTAMEEPEDEGPKDTGFVVDQVSVIPGSLEFVSSKPILEGMALMTVSFQYSAECGYSGLVKLPQLQTDSLEFIAVTEDAFCDAAPSVGTATQTIAITTGFPLKETRFIVLNGETYRIDHGKITHLGLE